LVLWYSLEADSLPFAAANDHSAHVLMWDSTWALPTLLSFGRGPRQMVEIDLSGSSPTENWVLLLAVEFLAVVWMSAFRCRSPWS
jgi:hypothetical protein